MANETTVLTENVPLGLAEKYDAVAVRLDRSRNSLITEALAAWLDQEEVRHRMTLDALADVDAGRTVAHEAVKVWSQSLGTGTALPPPTR